MPSLWRMAVCDGTPRNALLVAIIVGSVLTIINQGDDLVSGRPLDWLKAGLTYIVPYTVATYGAVTAKRATWRKQHASDDYG